MTDTQRALLDLLTLAVEKKAIKKAIFSKPDDRAEQKTVLTLRQIGRREILQAERFCTDNKALHENILKQNADSKTYSQKALGEVSALSIANTATAETVINLPMYGTVYSDVVLTWTSSNADVAVVSDRTLTFNEVTAKTKVTITVTATIAGIEATKEFTVEVNP